MREGEQGSVPTSVDEAEVFTSLRLAEPQEKVEIALDERMLSIHGKRKATINLRLGAIDSLEHHSTTLMPMWITVLGGVLVWIGWRIMVAPLHRFMFLLAGVLFLLSRYITSKPTITIHTSSREAYVVFGDERTLARLGYMVNQLLKGKSLAKARAMLAALEGEMGMDWAPLTQPVPIEPVVIQQPATVNRFLAEGASVADETDEEALDSPEWLPTDDPAPLPATVFHTIVPGYLVDQHHLNNRHYPTDHRPGLLDQPVLQPSTPTTPPPMHQTAPNQASQTPYQPIPSFWSPDAVHIPHRPTDIPPDEEEETKEVELLTFEPEQTPPSETTPSLQRSPTNPVSPSLRQREVRPLAHRTVPRRLNILRKKAPRSSLQSRIPGRLRRTSHDFLRLAVGPGRPSPFSTSESSAAMREQAQRNTPPNQEVLRSLSAEHGGDLNPEDAERYHSRAQQLLAEAALLSEGGRDELEGLSFSDLTPSKDEEDNVNVPRLDED